MARAQGQRAARPGASTDDMLTTRELWTTTCLSATEIGLSFTPQVTRNVILGRVRKMGLIGFNRPPKPFNVVKLNLPPPEQRPKPVPRAPAPVKQQAPVVDQTPAAILKRLSTPTETMRPFTDRRHGECAYPIDLNSRMYFCCAPVARGSYCAEHARRCYGGAQ